MTVVDGGARPLLMPRFRDISSDLLTLIQVAVVVLIEVLLAPIAELLLLNRHRVDKL